LSELNGTQQETIAVRRTQSVNSFAGEYNRVSRVGDAHLLKTRHAYFYLHGTDEFTS